MLMRYSTTRLLVVPFRRSHIPTNHDRSSVNQFTERTHNCGQLSKEDIGKRVNLYGWVQFARFNNKIIALRDTYGVTQCVVDLNQASPSFRKSNIYNESVLKISGTVRERPDGHINHDMSTGEIEVLADGVTILSQANKNLPILTRDSSTPIETTLNNRLKYRYLDLRRQKMQHALRFRSKVCRIFREKLHDLNFVECETPTLFNRTPGGANEFVVPTQEENKFFSLVQSPQQFKQLLMVGGLDRYFQICRCYRDEPGRADRQPEFTQLDIELSFTNQNLIIELIDSLVWNLLTNISSDAELIKCLTSSFDGQGRLRKISYQDAFHNYGTDKPDTRFEWLIEEDKDGGLFVDIPHVIDHDELFAILEQAKQSANLLQRPPDISFEELHNHNTLSLRLKSPQRSDEARKLLGQLRIGIARELAMQGKKVYSRDLDLIWVTDFPLFTVDEQGKMEPNHHPFTAPTEDTVHLLSQNPLLVKAQHYDLVLNGQEIAGGSIRIHDAELQRQIFSDVLNVGNGTFDYFIEALSSGCPPHGGIAFGLDRLVAALLNRDSIRDVIAFPKAGSGRDLMSGCPEELTSEVRNLYHLSQ